MIAIGCTLAASGWWRGALAWTGMVGATFALMLTLKLVAYACAPPVLRSPSGHTAAAAIILGGLVVALGAGRDRAVLLAAAAGAALIGASRLLLDVHTAPEVALGGLVGIAGALGLSRLAGPPPARLRLGWLAAVAIAVVVLFHGWHLEAEPRIDRAALHAARMLHVCRGAVAETYEAGGDSPSTRTFHRDGSFRAVRFALARGAGPYVPARPGSAAWNFPLPNQFTSR